MLGVKRLDVINGGHRSTPVMRGVGEMLAEERAMALPMSLSYDQYGRRPIGTGERHRRRQAVSSTAPERQDSTNADAKDGSKHDRQHKRVHTVRAAAGRSGRSP